MNKTVSLPKNKHNATGNTHCAAIGFLGEKSRRYGDRRSQGATTLNPERKRCRYGANKKDVRLKILIRQNFMRSAVPVKNKSYSWNFIPKMTRFRIFYR